VAAIIGAAEECEPGKKRLTEIVASRELVPKTTALKAFVETEEQ